MKEYRDKLYSLKLFDGMIIGATYVQRVPGGWIFYNHDEKAMCFVPYNDEFNY